MKISINNLFKAFGHLKRVSLRSSRKHRVAAAILAGGLSFVGATTAPAVELIQNGGFETNDGFNGDNDGFGWMNSDGIPVFDVYSHSTQIYYEGPAPTGAGDWYMHTVGVSNSEGVYQEVDLTIAATPSQIDAGTVQFDLSGWLAGYTAQDDHPDLSLQFFDAGGAPIAGALVLDGSEYGPGSNFVTTVTGADPDTFDNPIAAWKQYQAVQGVFIGARTARVSVLASSLTGNGNDNYIDLVSFDVEDTGVEQFMKIQVNTNNGLVSMANGTSDPVSINFYEILSPAGSLSVTGWNSFDDQDLDALGGSPGQSWNEGGGSDSNQLIEAFLLGNSEFTSGESQGLGQAFDVSVGTQDLEFYYAGTDGQRLRGIVEYVAGISGDFDGNGVYECADIDQLVGEIAAGTNNGSFDLTGDGVVNLADRDAWLAEAGAAQLASGNSYLLGDANLDGVVDVSDFNLWNGAKFTNNDTWCNGDFNADGVTDVSDFNLWNMNKFTSADTQAVPEPTFQIWCGLLSLGLLRYRRRK